MLKNKDLNRWLWRWHIIAGLITLPIILLLCLTGMIYLFKAQYNDTIYHNIQRVDNTRSTAPLRSYQEQLASVNAYSSHPVMQVFLPESKQHATGFRLHSQGHSRDIIYTNPYSGEVTGAVNQKDTLMYTVRKLHGELLLNTPGTLIIELVASWFIVLIITGLYIWWPSKTFSLSGLFTIRTRQGRKTLWRDIHAVFGFWLSLFMIIMISGGMPWTDIFGKQLKQIQQYTNTGYPQYWRSPKNLTSINNHTLHTKPLSIDDIAAIATTNNLKGAISIKIPQNKTGVFTLSNRAFWLSDQQVLHIDQYSGEIIQSYHWSDVGVLMNLRQLAMRFHQGEYGLVNWWAVLLLTLLFSLSTIGGLMSYIIRKPKGRWGLPTMPDTFHIGKGVLSIIVLLGALFPLFGVSLLLITLYQWYQSRQQISATIPP